jgi:hypothetical protein
MQGNEVRYYDLVPYVSLLRTGTNSIAAQIGNTWSDYDDVAFDISLRAVKYSPGVPALKLQYSKSGTSSLSAETSSGTVWQFQSCDELSQTNWQSLETFTNLDGGVKTFQDSAKKPASFYRLVPY